MTPAWPLAANGGILPTLQPNPLAHSLAPPRPAPGTIHRTCMYTNRNERKSRVARRPFATIACVN